MTRKTLLAATALCILASTPALAGGKKLTGLGEFGWDRTGYDIDGSSNDLDSNMFHGKGSALWTWPDKLNVQADFGFNSNRLEYDGSNEFAVDTWKVGGGAFYRDPAQGSIGAQLHYQSLDVDEFLDGLSFAGLGEYFYDQKTTLGASIGYSSFDTNGFDVDGWQLGAYGKYYFEPNLGFRLGLDHSSYDVDNDDVDDLSLNGELEYLIPDCTTSIYGGLGFGSIDYDNNDLDYWRFGVGLRLHFGTEGSLIQRNRSEPLAGAMHVPFVQF